MKKFLKFTSYSVITVIVLCFVNSIILYLYPNFHTVLSNKIYRSGQLNTAQFEHYIDKYHIKSILNLRGKRSTRSWYQAEMRVIAATHIQHYDAALPAKGLVSAEKMQILTKIIANAPKPLLIHCWRGADRAGLGSAVALILFTKQPLTKIKRQVSWKYGAIAFSSVGKVELSYYQHWLQQRDLTSSAENFSRWLQQIQAGKTTDIKST